MRDPSLSDTTARKPRASARTTPSAGGDASFPARESIGLLMRIALFGLRSSFKAILARHNVPWSIFYYLRVLWEQDGISQRELTERVGTMQPNTVSALKTLESHGFVVVKRHASDRRSTHVFLTAKARRLMERMLPEMRATIRSVALANFTEKEEAEFRRLLNKMCDNVQGNRPQ